MNPELKLKFQQKLHDLHINSSMGVDENNIAKIGTITSELDDIARQLYWEVYHKDSTKEDVVVEEVVIKPENDVVEATAELRTRVKPHRPESK